MNRYPLWKYLLILATITFGCIYALPNLYGKSPALQIRLAANEDAELAELAINAVLKEAELEPLDHERGETVLEYRFADTVTQLKARDLLEEELGDQNVVALHLAFAGPEWLRQMSAEPMFLGLDLRGGVHFLMQVDMQAALDKATTRYVSDLRSLLREEKLRYRTLAERRNNTVYLEFAAVEPRERAWEIIRDNYPELTQAEGDGSNDATVLLLSQNKDAVRETQELALQQNITTLRKRVNELGVAEPIVQRQGKDRVVVQLPGVQDTARAKEILGATATLEFRLVDETHDVDEAEERGRDPVGTRLYRTRGGLPLLLERDIVVTGDRIIAASSGITQDTGEPAVFVNLDGRGARQMTRKTRDNVGRRMAVVFIETKSREETDAGGERVFRSETVEEVITSPVIREQLGKRFQITGLESTTEARDLSLLLRAGSLAAPVRIIEERTVGPSLGQDNIDRGAMSMQIGMALVLLFMVLYYRTFGFIAGVSLAINIILLVALLSGLQATLTLPGIAGIVLTVGMAVDANVLIFERIREELRNGNSPQASIHAGYEKALSTIADANITTLIAALVLFGFGTGPIKGFAVTLSLGILTSMFSAIMISRMIVNLFYGRQRQARLAI